MGRRPKKATQNSAAAVPTAVGADGLFDRVVSILEEARGRVVRVVNHETVTAYWLIGREIVVALQGGEERAEYGARLIEDLSKRLMARYGNGFSTTNLKYFRTFYQAFSDRAPSIRHPAGDELIGSRIPGPDSREEDGGKGSPAGSLSGEPETRHLTGDESGRGFHPALSWSHYRALMRVEKPAARDFYEDEAVACGWSKLELERQIATLYYERLLMSKDKEGMLLETRQAPPRPEALTPLDVLKDPYVLEFLDLPDIPRIHESDLEAAIIEKLQQFLLELGRGFSLVARQKRLRFDYEDFYVDLVFYNYLLKCFVLIDLKVGKLTHQDVGQMDGYVRMFEAHAKVEGDNPTIGLILCSEKNQAVARYSVLHESRQLFAAKYLTYLPTEEELRRELERERRLIEAREAEEVTGRQGEEGTR